VFTRSYVDRETSGGRPGVATASPLKAGRAGASHAEWIFEAIQELRSAGGAERVGVWLEETGAALGGEDGAIFRGEVWEAGVGTEVLEWTRLTTEAPLRLETLKAGLSCEYNVEVPEAGPILGPELELKRVLWAPVMVRHTLRGLVMQGTQHRKKGLPRAQAEKVADELGLLLELEEERKLAAARRADLELWARIRRLLAERQVANMVLGQLAESCTRGEAMGGAGAVFAVIGEMKNGAAPPVPGNGDGRKHLLVRAQSGEAAWAYSVNGGPLEALWREAVATCQVAVAEAGVQPLARDISRTVAIPVERGEQIVGVLLAGLPRQRATLDTLERLEWRAALALEVLDSEQRVHTGVLDQLWQKAYIEASEEPAVLVDRQGLLVGVSKGAQELLRGKNGLFTPPPHAPMRFGELFSTGHAEQAQTWFDRGAQTPSRPADDTLKTELCGGVSVTLRRFPSREQGFCAVALEPVEKSKNGRPPAEGPQVLQLAMEWLEEGVAVYGGNGEILARNGMFYRMLGIAEKDEAQLATLDDVIRAASKNASDPEQFAADWRALAQDCREATQEELMMELPVRLAIERYARPILDAAGKLTGRVEVYRNLPALRMFQTRMAQTETLASLGQSVTRILHELNNPLTAICGHAQRLLQQGQENGLRGDTVQILQQAERASGIVRQLLDLPREAPGEMQWLSLNELVQRTTELQKAALELSGLQVQLQMEEGLPRVRGDYRQLQQVLLNLLQNAQQAQEESGGGNLVVVRTARAGPGRVKLEVRDDGPGIPEALQARIFDPFFTTKAPGKGTGLGLAIVNGFVRKHGGTIHVESNSGSGACFVVELPCAAEQPEKVRGDEEQPEPPAAEPQVGDRQALFVAMGKIPRVLVIEDEPTVSTLIADVLREEGMEVNVFADGQKALESTRGCSYDLAMCDMNMPGMDGPDFFAELAAAQNPLRERILFVTGDAIGQRTQEFLERVQLPHVAKPFRVEELCLAVRKMLWGQLQTAGLKG